MTFSLNVLHLVKNKDSLLGQLTKIELNYKSIIFALFIWISLILLILARVDNI
jgi:hypothetical protein